jgi:hypothetical protein
MATRCLLPDMLTSLLLLSCAPAADDTTAAPALPGLVAVRLTTPCENSGDAEITDDRIAAAVMRSVYRCDYEGMCEDNGVTHWQLTGSLLTARCYADADLVIDLVLQHDGG